MAHRLYDGYDCIHIVRYIDHEEVTYCGIDVDRRPGYWYEPTCREMVALECPECHLAFYHSEADHA